MHPLRSLFLIATVLFSMASVFAQDAPPEVVHVVVLPNQEWKLISERLEAYLSAFQYWLNSNCELTEDQKQKLSVACRESFARSKTRFDLPHEKQQELGLSEYLSTPIIFTGADDVAPSLFDQELNGAISAILTPAQLEAYNARKMERQEFFHHSSADHIFGLIDEMMYLRSSQRQPVRDRLHEVEPHFTNGLYTFRSNFKSFKSKRLTDEEWFPKDLLTSAQIARSNARNKERIFFLAPQAEDASFFQIDGSCTDEEFLKIVDKKLEVARKSYEDQHSVIIDGYRDLLDKESLDHLLLASRGSKERVLTDWYRGQVGQLHADLPQGYVREHYYIFMPDYSSLDFDGVWSMAMTTGKFKELYQERGEQRNDLLKSYLSMIFDQELWLTPKQKEQLEPYFHARVDFVAIEPRDYRNTWEFRSELKAFARVLNSIPDEKMEGVLSAEQMKVWKVLKRNFSVRENEIWYPQIHEASPLEIQWRLPYCYPECY